jgi:hypothetical protein
MVNEMTYYGDELDKGLKEKLDLLQETPPRDPIKASQRRDEYLKQVKYLQYGKPVFSIAGLLNSRAWKSLFSQRPSLVPFAAAVLLIFGLVFGSVGTVYAAQDSLPNDLLYSIKLTGENLRLAFTADTEDRISLLTSYADRRLQEATILDAQEQPIPVELATLMDGYINELISLTASLDENAVQEDPIAVSRTLRPQDRDQARTNPENDNQLELTQLREMTEACHRIASTGDGEFNQIQNKFQNQFKYLEQEQAQGVAPDSPFTHMREQTFKHQQGVTSTLTSTITTTLTITPEITATRTITPGQYGPGSCDPADGVLRYICSWVWGPGPFYGDRPVNDGEVDDGGYGSGGSSGPQQPSEPPKAGEPKQSPETPNNGDSGKDDNQEGSSGSQNSKP